MNILQIELLTNDLSATEHFYAQKMGLPVAFQNTDTITFVAGSSLLTFNRTDTTAYPRYHFAFNIPHNRLDEATAWVESFAEPLDVRTPDAETLLTEVIDMSLPLVDVIAVPEALLTDDDEPAFLLTVEDATPIPFPLLLSVRPLLP